MLLKAIVHDASWAQWNRIIFESKGKPQNRIEVFCKYVGWVATPIGRCARVEMFEQYFSAYMRTSSVDESRVQFGTSTRPVKNGDYYNVKYA